MNKEILSFKEWYWYTHGKGKVDDGSDICEWCDASDYEKIEYLDYKINKLEERLDGNT